ncbi:IS3 family transposase [Staphylococcus equorum]
MQFYNYERIKKLKGLSPTKIRKQTL